MGKLDKHFLPDFFIPGVAKCGTTTLHDLFEKHPQISMSKIKEPGYWKNKKFNAFSELEISNYKNLFTNKSVLNGESSTAYMFHDSFIKNIKKHYKTYPKFIFILRNPIDRYESHFNWMKGLGLEKLILIIIFQMDVFLILTNMRTIQNFILNLVSIISGS